MTPVVQVDINNFQIEVIDRSQHVPVVVEFWSPTVPQCATLSAQLQQFAISAGGKWVLAKMNVSDPQNQQLAMQLQIQGIPAVKAFQNGQIVDEFSGVPPLPQLQAWLERFGSDESNQLVAAARQAMEDQQFETASNLFKSLQEMDAEDIRPFLGFAEIAISMGDLDAATSIIAQVDENKIDDETKGWHSKIELLISGFGKDKSVYEKALEKNPDDYEARYELAMLNATSQEYDAAFGHLIYIVSRNPKFREEAARLSAIKLFDVVGPDSELAIEWRKKLGRAMY